jgi:spermidine/putrescine transport system substrate-binding protein
MTLMDFYYNPQVQAVVEYYNDYICPVPGAKGVLQSPGGWSQQTLTAMKPEIGLPTATTANAPTVFPTAQYITNSRSYYQYKNQEELTAWNNLFLPITQGA